MFEALDKLNQREAMRVNPAQFQPPRIKTMSDIQTVLAELDPDRALDGPEVVLRTTMRGESEDERGNPVMRTYAVSAPTRSRSKRSILLEGFEVVRKQAEARALMAERVIPIQVNGRDMAPPCMLGGGAVFVDPLIRQWLSGQRRGMLICWDLDDGYTYRYDIVAHKLTRTRTDEDDADQ